MGPVTLRFVVVVGRMPPSPCPVCYMPELSLSDPGEAVTPRTSEETESSEGVRFFNAEREGKGSVIGYVPMETLFCNLAKMDALVAAKGLPGTFKSRRSDPPRPRGSTPQPARLREPNHTTSTK